MKNPYRLIMPVGDPCRASDNDRCVSAQEQPVRLAGAACTPALVCPDKDCPAIA
jgi:hypothetical protein